MKFKSLLITSTILILFVLAGCGPSAAELAAVDYTPQERGDWEVSTPEAQGLDPDLVAQLYLNATEVETIRSLLVIKNGYLVAEDYFHGGGIDEKDRLQSATKSYTSAAVGIAIEEGCLTSVDQKMMEFFPELAARINDPRKNEITIQELLQMRAGYPWEESSAEMFELLYHGFESSNLVDVPLVYDPGTDFDYSSLSAHLAGIIVARACDTDLKSFEQEHLFEPLGVEIGEWITDWEGNYNGHGDMYFTARDMAKFGLLYLDDGVYEGEQIVPADWVEESLQTYTEDAWDYRIGRNMKEIGYGYQWWSNTAGSYRYNFAWGHGGQQIAIVDDLDMVVVVTADPLFGEHGDRPWKLEKQNLNLVADFIASLPGE
ncbi:MAG: serine hydrolase [Anaerolineae bacterium]|nr:serine hydrolase [Anaerolineae bacterium]